MWKAIKFILYGWLVSTVKAIWAVLTVVKDWVLNLIPKG